MNTNPYQTAETSGRPQNELEARALVKTAARLNDVKENWEEKSKELTNALDINRKLWTIFVSDVCEESNPLPLEIKQNIVNLAHFIFQHTFSIMAKPAPEPLGILIDINMNIARGLNEQTKRLMEEAEAAASQSPEQSDPSSSEGK